MQSLNSSFSSAQCLALVLEYLQDKPQPTLHTPLDVINFICRVVETYDGAAKAKERGSGEQKKTLAIRVLNETLPELRVRHIISADLYDQTRMLLVDRESLSGFIDSLIHIWNELQRSGLCAKLFCC